MPSPKPTRSQVLAYTHFTIKQRTDVAKRSSSRDALDREPLLEVSTQDKISPVRIRRASSTRRNGHNGKNGTVFSNWGWGQGEGEAEPDKPAASFVA